MVGEGGNQLDLLFGEGPHRVSPQGDDTNRRSLAEKRYTKKRTKPSANPLALKRVFGIAQNVDNMNYFVLKQDPSGYCSTIDYSRVTRYVFSILTREPVV